MNPALFYYSGHGGEMTTAFDTLPLRRTASVFSLERASVLTIFPMTVGSDRNTAILCGRQMQHEDPNQYPDA